MKAQEQAELMNKIDIKVEKKVNYIGIMLTNMNCVIAKQLLKEIKMG